MPEGRKHKNKYQFGILSFGKSYNSRNILTGIVQKHPSFSNSCSIHCRNILIEICPLHSKALILVNPTAKY